MSESESEPPDEDGSESRSENNDTDEKPAGTLRDADGVEVDGDNVTAILDTLQKGGKSREEDEN